MAGATTKQERAAASPAAKSPSGSNKLLIFGGLLLAFVTVQIAVTEFLLGRGHSSSDAGRQQNQHEKKVLAPVDTGHSHNDKSDEEFAEVALGNFSFSNRTAVSGVVLHVDFNLAAVVSQGQAALLDSHVRVHRGRIREAVNTIVRNSSYEELSDPSLASLKRQIREEINRLLDHSLVTEVVINEIRVLEQ